MRMFRVFLLMMLVFMSFNTGFVGATERKNIPYPENLWKGIIGEAVGEGYKGMYAVACVYHNRLKKGLPLGCVALKRRDLDEFVRKQGRFERVAKGIIEEIFVRNGKDITLGSTHYENIERFGIPYWAKNMVRTVKIGKHTFFKKERS